MHGRSDHGELAVLYGGCVEQRGSVGDSAQLDGIVLCPAWEKKRRFSSLQFGIAKLWMTKSAAS